MNFPVMSLWLLLLLSLLSQGVLAIVLLLRENQHSKIQKGLLDRILVSDGLDPLPDIHPISDLVSPEPRPTTERIEQVIKELARKKRQGQPVHFNIPGMATIGLKEKDAK